MLDGRKCILPNSSFAPFFTFLFTFIGNAHRFPRNPVWLVDVFCGSLPSLLVNQIKIAERRFLVSIQFKKHSFSREFVGRRDGIVARISNISRSVSCELLPAELK